MALDAKDILKDSKAFTAALERREAARDEQARADEAKERQAAAEQSKAIAAGLAGLVDVLTKLSPKIDALAARKEPDFSPVVTELKALSGSLKEAAGANAAELARTLDAGLRRIEAASAAGTKQIAIVVRDTNVRTEAAVAALEQAVMADVTLVRGKDGRPEKAVRIKRTMQ